MFTLSSSKDLDALLDAIGDKRIVMLGEASHGTHEFYTWRAAISERLIEEKKFNFIAVEGDWPDCYRINRYVKGYADAGGDMREVLQAFDRWPTWMWANWEVVALGEWLREHNKGKSPVQRIGFYGLDVYSLWDSMKEMMNYLEKEDREAAEAVKKAFRCFEPFQGDEQSYARFSLNDRGCSKELIEMLKQIRLKAQHLDGDREAGFNTEQNALIAVNAEKYYRSMFDFDNESWNIRDRHMMETLDRLLQFHGENAKVIVWAHNTHIGDARATNMRRAGMINIGQLAREKYGEEDVYLAGFATFNGSVIAGQEWGAPMEEMEVPNARPGSIEMRLHQDPGQDHYIFTRREKGELFSTAKDHRAIGVVYDPAREKYGNYVPSILSQRYDAMLFIDETSALHALHLTAVPGKVPETFPYDV